MATSGTVSQTSVTVDDLVTLAVTRAGKSMATVGGELLANIRLALYFISADLGNDGINLWCLKKSVENVVAGQSAYQLPAGVNDVTNVLYRTLNGPSPGGAVTVSLGSVTYTPTAPVSATNLTCTFTTGGTTTMAIEYTTDGTTWITYTALDPMTVLAGAVFTIDIDNSTPAIGWRIRDLSGVLLGTSNVMFRTVNTELPMARLNHDDYTNLPNKQTPGAKSLQYWFDKQIKPRVHVWPVSSSSMDQIVVWAASEVQDPGDLSASLAVPTRWYQSFCDTLAYRTAMLIPPSELPPGRLDILRFDAAESKKRASDGESDGSSFRLSPRIRGYTR